MRNYDLETFHSKIIKSSKALKGYTEDSFTLKIIKSCRLKPLDIFDKEFTYKSKVYLKWADEFGNYVDFKESKIHYGMTTKGHTTTDLFYGRSFDDSAKESISVLEIESEECDLYALYGKDDYVRAFFRYENKLIRTSPLMMGINTLKMFLSNLDKDIPIDLKKIDCLVPLAVKNGTITNIGRI